MQDTDSESIIKEDPNNRRVEDDTPRTIIQNYLREGKSKNEIKSFLQLKYNFI